MALKQLQLKNCATLYERHAVQKRWRHYQKQVCQITVKALLFMMVNLSITSDSVIIAS